MPKLTPERLREIEAVKTKNLAYSCWAGMIGRCCNPNIRCYKQYGAVGITVCEQWRGKLGFAQFLADMGHRPSIAHSIDRYPDRNGNYEPGNCRWATYTEQNRNEDSARLITVNGETRCLTEWAEISGLKLPTLHRRLAKGWSAEDAITRPHGALLREVAHSWNAKQLSARGATKFMTQWSQDLGISTAALRFRLRQGWSVERALFEPLKRRLRKAVTA